jgi:IS605 OrfB family transposase
VVVTSGGFKSGNPKHLGNDLYRLRKAQRRLSRKEKGSQNWKKQKRRVAKIHAEIKDKRNDLLHKLSRKIVDENQVIALETLNVKGMQRREASAASVQNRSLSRSISDTGWSTLVQYIEYFATSNTSLHRVQSRVGRPYGLEDRPVVSVHEAVLRLRTRRGGQAAVGSALEMQGVRRAS